MEAGSPSYAAIVRLITEQRMAAGLDFAAARVARSTVYDAFRFGRRSLDPDLVEDIAGALGRAECECIDVASECRTIRAQLRVPTAPRPVRAVPDVGPDLVSQSTIRARRSAWWVLGALALSVGLNLGGRELVILVGLPLYLDMMGTAVAAIMIGPWRGALVGLVTSVVGAAISGWNSVPFALVEIAGALVWGYGVRRWRMGRTIPRFFVLNVIVALVCTAVAVPIIAGLDGGFTGSGADSITRSMDLVFHNLLLSVASQNVLTSLADKVISGFVALTVVEAAATTRTEGGLVRSRSQSPFQARTRC
ncbi:MAG TPA: ECF transporter S component [Marmoricola sp.]